MNDSASSAYRAALAAFLCALVLGAPFALAQEDAEDDEDEVIEEIVVTGSQIRGADISGILPVTVLTSEEIEFFGAGSGDELFDMLPEQGQNYFSEAENISGGVNSVRGDVGAFNLRNLGTGNTLVLLNGRRMVNEASYQTEEVGGSFVPVNTVNPNTIPVYGIERIEILKDGASAIYGADAVAGVVNHVLKSDFEGFRVQLRGDFYEHVGRETYSLNLEWGKYFNDGATNLAVMFDYKDRDRVHSSEDDRWADSDFRRRIPENSLWNGDTNFRNNSANSLYGQFDIRPSVSRYGIRGRLTDNSGEFETYPIGHENCQWQLNETTCGGVDGQGTYRYNINEFRDLSGELTRSTLFAFLNHTFDNGVESFTEFMYWDSDSVTSRHPSAPFSAVKLRVGAENYYNPFGPCGSPNRLPDDVIGSVPCSGVELEIDNYRFAQVPRIVESDGSVSRLLQGLRGEWNTWDWEGAVLWSKAEREDLTRNRLSNLLMAEALFDPTPAAYNPFSGGVNSNIERALVDVYRNSETDIFLMDLKLSTTDLFSLPAGPVAFLAGGEYREESFVDDRDPRLDGTIVFTDYQGDTYPLVSDVVNSSPTPDNEGDRNVTSLFAELQAPLLANVDMQAALRYEDFSDVGDSVVGKFALGWQVVDAVGLRGSWSEAFRAPNLITVNEVIVARQNTRNDFACIYAATRGGDPDQDTLDCRNSIQRIAQGSDALKAERSTNYSVGLVVTPLEDWTITLDYWSIEKEDTIGLFGEENHTVLDLLRRLEHGAGNCDALQANSAVEREPVGDDEAAIYTAAGICPAGDIKYVEDHYANLNTRNVKGYDLGLFGKFDSGFGKWTLRYQVSFLDEFEQEPGGASAELASAKDAGVIPVDIPIGGFGDLIENEGYQKQKHNLLVTWRKGDFGASLGSTKLGKFYQESGTLTRDDGTKYWIPSFTRWNATFDYYFGPSDLKVRMRLGIRNFTDERAPLADRYFGYFADAHSDYGRYYYLSIRVTGD